MYQLLSDKLRVSKDIASTHSPYIKKVHLIILQHLFEDTLEFIMHFLKSGGTIEIVLGKQYVSDETVVKKLRKSGIPFKQINYRYLEKENTFLLNIILHALQTAKKEDKIVIIHEVGGYFNKAIQIIPEDLKQYFGGVVEDTTFGFNKYKKIENQLQFPVFHVARSQLKEIEAAFVGEAIVLAFNNLMRSIGVSIPGRQVLIIGYGMVGKNIAKYLKINDLRTTVYDIDHLRLLHAFKDGHEVILNKDDLTKFDVIFSATGSNAVTFEDIKNLKDGVILASGGSKDIEFDIEKIKKNASKRNTITTEIVLYTVYGKKIVVIRDGTAINLREKSIPSEIVDIVFSEILSCIIELIKNRNNYRPGLHELPISVLKTISRKWLYALLVKKENQSLHHEITNVLSAIYYENHKAKKEFKELLNTDIVTVEQNPRKHLGVLFLPINKKSEKVLLAHHKEADLWLSPGGYIHQNTTLLESVKNEIKKTLGVTIANPQGPFLCSIVSINNPQRECKKHYDIWYTLPCNNGDLSINETIYDNCKWVTIQEAKKLATDPHTLSALQMVKQTFFLGHIKAKNLS